MTDPSATPPAAASSPAPSGPRNATLACLVVGAIGAVVLLGVIAVAVVGFVALRRAGVAPRRAGIGSTFERETVGQIRDGSAITETRLVERSTLTALDAANATLRVEAVDEQGQGKVRTDTVSLDPSSESPSDASFGPIVETRTVSLALPAGTFECQYTKRSSEDGSLERWRDPGLPLAVQEIRTAVQGRKTIKITTTLKGYSIQQ